MAKIWAKSFYNSKKWKKCRSGYISLRKAIDGGLCEICKQRVGYIVHHKETLTADNICNSSVALNYDMLMYVCQDCHNKIDHDGKTTQNRYFFDADGQISPL